MLMENMSIDELTTNSSAELDSIPESTDLFNLILSIILIVILSIGFVGNLLVIYVVLYFGRLKTVTNTYLLHLAFSDLVFLSGIPFFISSILTRSWIFGSFFCRIFLVSQGVNQYTSIIILALLSFDRFLAVCYASKSITWRSRVNPNTLLILIWILSLFLMLPIILFTTLVDADFDKVQCAVILSTSESSSVYFFYTIYTSTITFFIPICLMIAFHTRIVYHLQCKILQQHRHSHTSMRTRRKVTILVLSVITVHILCCLPYWTFQMLTTSGLLPQTSGMLFPTSSITQSLLFVNSSTNPILYAFISETFRTSFQRVFYCCLRTDNTQFLQRPVAVRRSINPNHSLPLKTTSPMIINDTTRKQNIHTNQHLTISTESTNIDLLNRGRRLSSLAPPASIYLSEASCVSDV